MKKAKEPIKLRSRLTKNGSKSLYLDIYIDGKRSYEYLKLYLIPERTKQDKEKNKETMRLAEAIRGQRLVDLQNGRFGFDGSYKLDMVFLDYYRMLCERKFKTKESLGNWGNWYSCLKHLEMYTKKGTKFKDIAEAVNGRTAPEWLEVDSASFSGTVSSLPKREQIDVPVDEMMIVELYSK